MSMLTKCYAPKGVRIAVRAGGFAKVVVLCVVAMLFALARLNLQFAVDDMRRQTNAYQERQIELRSRIAQVTSDVETEKRGERLLAMAQLRLEMSRPDVTEAGRVMVTQADRSRIEGAVLEIAVKPGDERPARFSFAALASRVGIVSQALAAEADGR